MQVEMLLRLGRFHAGAVPRGPHADVDDRMGEEQHLDVVGIAPVLDRLFANLVAIGLHAFDAAATSVMIVSAQRERPSLRHVADRAVACHLAA
jgi:hypothetical protein